MKTNKIGTSSMIFGLAFFASIPAFAVKTIFSSKFNPSPEGTYEIRNESHNNTTDTHNLDCQNPGPNGCLWEISPWSKMHVYDQVSLDVIDNIANGNMIGTMAIEDGTVSWNAISLTDYSYTLTVTTP